ncbi:MAG: hypothetical protein H7A46_26095 [Verrucomicrobiales bacterium]|nr:hypothetical protein [Verrucomicrobiales bacterium]
MPTPITIGHIEAHEKLTARLFYQPHGETGFIDAGNVGDYKYAPEKSYVGRMRSEGGAKYLSDEQADTISDRWEFTLDEHDVLNQKLVFLATKGSDAVQAEVAAPTGTATITSVTPGRSYFVGKVGLNTVVAKVAAVTLVEGTDYLIDTAAGILTVIDGGGVNQDDDVDLTFGCAAVTHQVFTGQDNPLFRGSLVILEINQFSKVPLREIAFTGVIYLTAWPEQSGEFGKYTARAVPTTKPTIKRRSAA